MILLSMRLRVSSLGKGYCVGKVPEKACPARSKTSRLGSFEAAFMIFSMCPAQGKLLFTPQKTYEPVHPDRLPTTEQARTLALPGCLKAAITILHGRDTDSLQESSHGCNTWF